MAWIFIYTRNMRVIGHISIMYSEFKLINSRDSINFSRVGLIHLYFKRRKHGGRKDIELNGASQSMRGSRGLEVHQSSSTYVALKESYNGLD